MILFKSINLIGCHGNIKDSNLKFPKTVLTCEISFTYFYRYVYSLYLELTFESYIFVQIAEFDRLPCKHTKHLKNNWG